MKTLFNIINLLLLTYTMSINGQEKPTMMVILAHPDDEMSIAPVLTQYRDSHHVQLVIAFDGWETDEALFHVDGLEFESTANYLDTRRKESQCGCQTIGIDPPIFLGYSSRFSAQKDIVKYFIDSSKLKKDLYKIISETEPALIITFGPDGDTGHQDHRAISNMVTEVVLTNKWLDDIPVFYISWTERDQEKFKGIPGLFLNTIDKEYVNVVIHYSEVEEQKYLNALSCYPSQYDQETVEDWKVREKKDELNEFYFRRLMVSDEKQSGF